MESKVIIHRIEVRIHPSGKAKPIRPERKRMDVYTHYVGLLCAMMVFEIGEPRIINLKTPTEKSV